MLKEGRGITFFQVFYAERRLKEGAYESVVECVSSEKLLGVFELDV